ncbi:MAG: hypothetical protein DRI84_01075 [Bacteroidetes bacterium]|nr:MAG: hypothetical protein DRI84_01075 [Bacteroidota bacterium]
MRIWKLLFFCFLVLANVLNLSANTDSSLFTPSIKDSVETGKLPRDTIWPKSSSDYYYDYSNMLGLFLYAKQKYNSFTVYDPLSKTTLEYTPNKQLNMGFGFHYKWLGIGIALNFGFVNNDDDAYGKTTRLDWQSNMYMKRAVFDFYLQYYKNFYLENPQNVFSGWKGDNKPYVRPDIASASIGLGGMYVFNYQRFSYKAAFLQTAIQKKTAGSFLLGAQVFYQELEGDSSLFPSNTDFDTLGPVISHSALYFGLVSAYAYNIVVLKHYFISLSLSATIQFGKTASMLETGEIYGGYMPVLHFQPRVAVGINKVKWYAGASFVRDSFVEITDGNASEFNFSFRSGNFRIFLGRRFNWLSRKELLK